jgi:hypothetical protein
VETARVSVTSIFLVKNLVTTPRPVGLRLSNPRAEKKHPFRVFFLWSRHEDSNPGHPLYKSGALPTELCRQTLSYLAILAYYRILSTSSISTFFSCSFLIFSLIFFIFILDSITALSTKESFLESLIIFL